jgi:putative exosortase-associated protein (TIGR04073 family)
MMSRQRQVVSATCAVLMLAGLAMPASAAEEAEPSYVRGMLRKLGRGITNVVTCPAELLRQPERMIQEEGPLQALSVGILQGAWMALVRGTVGLYETATFFVENPDGFEPILKPEFVFGEGL